jgi:Bacterial capsule synthesis protein PGA_cap
MVKEIMIFVGDIALPKGVNFNIKTPDNIFKDKVTIANLEGPIIGDKSKLIKNSVGLYSTSDINYLFEQLNIKGVSLANNHITDFHNSVKSTIDFLTENSILYCGAGENKEQASKEMVFNNLKTVFLAYGWKTIQCIPATKTSEGINVLEPKKLLQDIIRVKNIYKGYKIVLLLHWNYELELYPQPAHRQLAFKAIDYGADIIVGHHPHVVQGIEIYKNKPIIYSLGNWFIPQTYYSNKLLTYPDISNLQLAFEVTTNNNYICHWFNYDRKSHTINWIESEELHQASRVRELTPFAGFSHVEYIEWFKKNRRKRMALPIYKDIDEVFYNKIKDCQVLFRQRLIEILVQLNIKKGPR